MRWIVYEDSRSEQLFPLALARPVFELICGREGLRRRVQRWFPNSEWGAVLRSYLKDVYQEEHPAASINQLASNPSQTTLMINGRWLPEHRPAAENLNLDSAGFVDGELVWVCLSPEELSLLCVDDLETVLNSIVRHRRPVEASGAMLRRPWDLIRRNARQLEFDFRDEGLSERAEAEHVQCLGDPTDLYVSLQAQIDPYVVIDTRSGPVSIDRDVQIQSFTRIEGPCHIARGAKILRGLIQGGTTIGEYCRVGGEIEESILHSHVNKYHEGFLGHSYICPWVNLGAITTTSDLKSDYSHVQVPLQGELIDTGAVKVGSFIADHTKTAIDSMFNTGTSVGVMAMVLPGGRLLPRHIPSFCNIHFGSLAVDWPLEQSLQTARIAMQRRNCQFTPAAEALFRTLYKLTEAERNSALNKAAARRWNQTS
ncbi:MAG: hypothetical protein KDA81_11030 [Planctomycetaceae bacterium]|nr:hypothetical protein [Planctomycetaceae bacterium]